MNQKRAAFYMRVSTKGHGQNTETQALALRDYAIHRGFTIVEEYRDEGISGSKDTRPALDRLMRDARARVFDVVIVARFARFARFARSVSHLLRALEEFSHLGVDFISLSESVDTSTPMGKMIFTVLAAVAELERSIIRERVFAGVERARRQGKRFGRPGVIVDREKIVGQKAAGRSIKSIAKECGIARSTVRGILARVAECGSAAAELSS